MISFDTEKLNKLEKSIYEKTELFIKNNPKISITNLAQQCEVSPSKISKTIKKLGFKNFKEYKLFVSGMLDYSKKDCTEIDRIKNFLDTFDLELIDDFIKLMEQYEKIIFFGTGPTFSSLYYFTYKLNIVFKKNIFYTNEEIAVDTQLDEKTLLVVFSVSGKYTKYKELSDMVKIKGGEIAFVFEELNTDIEIKENPIFYLTKSFQNSNLQQHEKSRSIFFIFYELIFISLLEKSK